MLTLCKGAPVINALKGLPAHSCLVSNIGQPHGLIAKSTSAADLCAPDGQHQHCMKARNNRVLCKRSCCCSVEARLAIDQEFFDKVGILGEHAGRIAICMANYLTLKKNPLFSANPASAWRSSAMTRSRFICKRVSNVRVSDAHNGAIHM
jgi:hypothetical protein